MNRAFITVLISWLIAASCTKEEVVVRGYPRVNTLTTQTIDANGALLTGEIFYSNVAIRDHGFLWSPYANPLPGTADVFSLGPKESPGPFQAAVGWGLVAGKTYYMRAYARSDDKEVFGDVETFVAKGSPSPVISGIYPTVATWGDTVNLIGTNFSVLYITNAVSINGVNADILGGTRDTLQVRVPYTLAKEFSTFSISMQGQISNSPTQFQLKGPEIQSINPSNGNVGTTVTIRGLYLGSMFSEVYFNGVSAPISNIVSNGVVVKVPDGVPPGNVQVRIVTGDGNLFDTISFQVL
jgi:hypothetical protein